MNYLAYLSVAILVYIFMFRLRKIIIYMGATEVEENEDKYIGRRICFQKATYILFLICVALSQISNFYFEHWAADVQTDYDSK